MSTVPDPKTSLIEYLKTVDTPTVSNAVEVLKLRPRNEGFAPLQLRCLFPEFGRMVGYAVTAQLETMTKVDVETFDFGRMKMQFYDAVAAAPKPVVVVFQEIGPHPDFAAHCGEVMATTFQHLGAVGLVSDCAVRDIAEVRALSFHYFSRGAVASHGYSRLVRVGVPVQVCGFPIRPHDLLHGDENGLLMLPDHGLEKLPEAVAEIRKSEGNYMEFVRGSEFSLDQLRARLVKS